MNKGPVEQSLVITDITPEGLGIAEIEDRIVHVRNALPGEAVTARILKRRKGVRYADAVDIDAATASPDRRQSACAYFPRCGGCNLHHMDYRAQLALKQRQLEAALTANGVAAAHTAPPQSVSRLGYRRKARLGVRQVGEQVLVGFRESFSNRVARLTRCEVLSPALSELLAPLQALLPQLSVAARIPQIEVAQGDEETAIIVRHLQGFSAADMALWAAFERQSGVQVILQSAGYDTLTTLSGAEVKPLGYQLPEWGLCMQFMPHQFTQVNLEMNRSLIRHALSYLGDLSGKRVLDLFCGIGNFTLPLARAGAVVRGVEAAADAVDMARHNARLNRLLHVDFEVADLYHESAAHGRLLSGFDALVLDPPRSGAGVHLPVWLDGFDGTEVVYVSCNPDSFARDAAVLQTQGFRLSSVGIFDMFPHTAHVETMGYFRRG